jgi:hypothetical protein
MDVVFFTRAAILCLQPTTSGRLKEERWRRRAINMV